MNFPQKAQIPNVCKTEAGVAKANLNSEKFLPKRLKRESIIGI